MKPSTSLKLRRSIFAAFVALIVSGCATGPRFSPSQEVSSRFEAGQLLPGHRYYVGGPESKPNAIVALADAYEMASAHWRPVTVSEDSLKALVKQVGFVFNAEYKTAFIPNGACILTTEGEAIGVWYSVYAYSRVRLLEGQRIELSYPQANLPANLPTPL